MTRARLSQRIGGAMLEGVEYDSDSPLDDGFRGVSLLGTSLFPSLIADLF